MLANPGTDPDAGTSRSVNKFSIAATRQTHAAGGAAAIAGVGTMTLNQTVVQLHAGTELQGMVPIVTSHCSDGISTAQSRYMTVARSTIATG